MHDNQPPDGKFFLPEYQNIDDIFRTLVDKVKVNGGGQMGVFLVDGEVAGLMLLGPMEFVHRMSRVIAAIGKSPIVNFPGS